MRHRRVWFVLLAGVVVLVVLHFTKNQPTDVRIAHHKHRWPEYKYKFNKPDAFKTKVGDRDWKGLVPNVDKFKPLETAKEECAMAEREATVDYKTLEMYSSVYDGGDRGLNVWGNLQYDKQEVAQEQKLKVFLMPHSHADPGWLKTYEDYTIDTNNALTYMLNFLPTHPNMTFTWTEVSFFHKWWRTLKPDQKTLVKELVRKGQFELTSGSWTMTDEANPYFWASVDNIVEGQQFLQQELGVLPKVTWSNDPFGYGPSVPFLFQKTGINHLAINRVHKDVKQWMEKRKSIVFKWRQTWDTKGDLDMLTHVLPFMHYDIPNSCGPDPSVCCQFDFKRLTNFGCPGPKPQAITQENVARKAEMLYDQYRKTASMFQHQVLFLVLGDDFRYIDEREWYQQHDNYMPLFEYMNTRKDWNIEAKFGTFSEYFDALAERTAGKDHPFPVVSGDFFPYNDFVDNYWTGYFTTRPFYKRMDRVLQAHIRAADILSSFAVAQAGSSISAETRQLLSSRLTRARRNLALFQHHDAITGTSKLAVVKDYGMKLFVALLDASDVLAASAQLLLSENSAQALSVPAGAHLQDSLALVLNELPPSYNATEIKMPILLSAGKSEKVVIYNSLAHRRLNTVRLHVTTAAVSVALASAPDAQLKAQINPVLEYMGGIRKDLFELVFHLELPPLGLISVVLTGEAKQPDSTSIAQIYMRPMVGSDILAQTFYVREMLTLQTVGLKTSRGETKHDPITGLIKAIKFDDDVDFRELKAEFWHYTDTRSGPYLFVPNQPSQPWPMNNASTVFLVQGDLVSEMNSFLARVHHRVSLYDLPGPAGKELHVRNTVDLRQVKNSELVMRLQTDLQDDNDKGFFTDSIGLQLLRREYYTSQAVERNYYPMPSAAGIQNDRERFTVLTGQPHGVTRPKPGLLEIMLDRILTVDDYKGVGFADLVRDNVPARSEFSLIFEKKSPDAKKSRMRSLPTGLYHSATAHHALQSLLYPAYVFHRAAMYQSQPHADVAPTALSQYRKRRQSRSRGRSRDSAVLAASHVKLIADSTPLSTSLPCDSQMLSLRSGQSLREDQRLLILHRAGVDCKWGDTPFECGNSDKKSVQDLLTALKADSSLEEMNLSGVRSSEQNVQSDSALDMDPMDLKTYRVRLNSS